MSAREPTLDGILDLFAEKIADHVMAKLLACGIVHVATPKVYTTNKSGPHIPAKSRRWMKDHVQAMPGARKVGRDWEIDVVDYEAWAKAADRQATTGKRPRDATDVLPTEDDLRHEARLALKSAGFRRTRDFARR